MGVVEERAAGERVEDEGCGEGDGVGVRDAFLGG